MKNKKVILLTGETVTISDSITAIPAHGTKLVYRDDDGDYNLCIKDNDLEPFIIDEDTECITVESHDVHPLHFYIVEMCRTYRLIE